MNNNTKEYLYIIFRILLKVEPNVSLNQYKLLFMHEQFLVDASLLLCFLFNLYSDTGENES